MPLKCSMSIVFIHKHPTRTSGDKVFKVYRFLISNRYIELYENITGEKFVKEECEDINTRIEKNVKEYLG